MRFSPRERQIVALAAQGLNTKAIAAALGVTPSGVKFHFSNIYDFLGYSGTGSRYRLIAFAYQNGMETESGDSLGLTQLVAHRSGRSGISDPHARGPLPGLPETHVGTRRVPPPSPRRKKR